MTRSTPYLQLVSVLTVLGCLATTSWAQPGGLSAVTSEHVAMLETLHQQASDFLLQNDFDGAIRIYSDILLLEPDDETAYTGLGQIYMVQGRYKHAHQAFENALHINPDNQVALAGIQKMMDPDGVEGYVSERQVESPAMDSEQVLAHAVVTAALDRPMLTAIGMEKRTSAIKAKKQVSAIPVAPVSAPMLSEERATVRRATSGHVTGSTISRPGYMHVQRAKMALAVSGFYEGPVNGYLTRQTRSALKKFQKRSGLPGNGRLTAQTWAALAQNL